MRRERGHPRRAHPAAPGRGRAAAWLGFRRGCDRAGARCPGCAAAAPRFLGTRPGLNATAARLLQNQTDIGNAIAPFYGTAAGQQLSALLHDHITIAVELLQDAKAGDTAASDAAKIRWYANANQIADFLSKDVLW